MGIISLEQSDRLYWLGRYSERVYTTLSAFGVGFDRMLDGDDQFYGKLCQALSIPNRYTSGPDFVEHYCFDKEDPNSVTSSLLQAYDNAIVLREEIGSETLAYIQLAVYDLAKARGTDSPLICFQTVMDRIVAFWGMADDSIPRENVRNIIKAGKRVERLDLYARLKYPREAILREVHRLSGRLPKTTLRYSTTALVRLNELAEADSLDYDALLSCVHSVMEG